MKLKYQLNENYNFGRGFVKEDDSDMMSPEEMKDEMLAKVDQLRNTTNQWSTRDVLTNFTELDFWKGGQMASIDSNTAKEIADALYDYVESLDPNDPEFDELYSKYI